MQSNLYFDICSIVVLIVVIFSLFIRKFVKGRVNQVFIALVFTVLISAITDIWNEAYGMWIVTNSYNFRFRYFLHFVYFLARDFTTPVFILYVVSVMGIWHKLIGKAWMRLSCLIPIVFVVIALILNFWNHKIYYIDDNMVYQRGEWITLLYIAAFFYMVLLMAIIIMYRKLIRRSTYYILMMFIPINIIAIVIQMLYKPLRLEVFASAVFIIVLAVGVQKPEEFTDYVVNCENYTAFLNQIRQSYLAKQHFSLLLIKFTNHRVLRDNIGIENYSMLQRRITDKISQLERALKVYGTIYYLEQGGFSVITDSSHNEELLDLGRVVVAYMREPMKIGQLEVLLDPKICLVQCPDDISDVSSLTNFANTFHTKLPAGLRVFVLSDIADSKDFKVKNDMETIINRGIANHNFQMYYQPIYDINKCKYSSAEALIRLIDDKYGFVSPALFIPEAEESGAIHQIGDFVLEDVCRFISSADFEWLGLEYIEINLSVSQCIESNLAEKIQNLMEKYGVRPDQINLEITETGVDYDPETTDKNIDLLHRMGITFSLDDYGTGYSNIKRVVSLPLHIVKLDKSLVDEMDDKMMWSVIKNTVGMLKKMKKLILVEGVEEERQYIRFAEIGCDYIQGYYFSKPLPEMDFLKFISAKNCGEAIDE